MPVICYAVIVVGSMAIALLVYTLVVFGWCGFGTRLPLLRSATPAEEEKSIQSPYLASSFKYEKGIEKAEEGSEPECVVCLTGFKDGENVSQLPRCKHSFHYSCIDMWLYSHSDCPLCRAPVERIGSSRSSFTITEENSGEILLDISILS